MAPKQFTRTKHETEDITNIQCAKTGLSNEIIIRTNQTLVTRATLGDNLYKKLIVIAVPQKLN